MFVLFCKMAIITLRVDDELKKKMEQLKEINWSEVAREAFNDKISEMEFWPPIDTSRLRAASSDIDTLRRTIRGWESTSEIRRWRQREL